MASEFLASACPHDCPSTCALEDGDRVRIGNRRGSVVVHARPFDGLQSAAVWLHAEPENGPEKNAATE